MLARSVGAEPLNDRSRGIDVEVIASEGGPGAGAEAGMDPHGAVASKVEAWYAFLERLSADPDSAGRAGAGSSSLLASSPTAAGVRCEP